jgi:DNA polymerase III alpha subunit
MVALLNHEHGERRIRNIIRELIRHNILIFKPHVNESRVKHRATKEGIRLGLSSIKFVGENASVLIEKHAPYTKASWGLFQSKNKRYVNARVVGALQRAGALDDVTI